MHDLCLRSAAAPQLGTVASRATFDSDYDAVLSVSARRDRLDTHVKGQWGLPVGGQEISL